MFVYQGQMGQDRYIHETYFAYRYNGIAIECGAFDGLTESSIAIFERYLSWKTINIEAYPEIYSSLCINRPRSVNLNLALSNKKDVVAFKHAVHPELGKNFGNGSISHKLDHMHELLEKGCSFLDYNVTTDTYVGAIDSLFTQNKLPNQEIDLFVLDVEGHELEVLEGMTGTTKYPKVMCVEYPIIGLDKLHIEMNRHGYVFHRTFQNNAYYLRSDTYVKYKNHNIIL